MVNPRSTYIPVRDGLAHAWLLNNDVTDSIGSEDGTASGTLTATTNRFSDTNTAYTFNGTDSRITISDLGFTPTTPLSFSVWLKPAVDADNNFSSQSFIVTNNVYMHIRSTGNGVIIRYENGIAYQIQSNLGTGFRDWVHVVGCFDGDKTLKLYINGVLIEEKTNSVGPQASEYLSGITTIGNNSSSYFDGDIDQVLIYNKYISDEEVKQLYEGYKPHYYTAKRNYLLNQLSVTSGNISDLEKSYLESETGLTNTSIEGMWFEWLGTQGSTARNLEDRWVEFLTGEGYSGHLLGMQKQYFEDNS